MFGTSGSPGKLKNFMKNILIFFDFGAKCDLEMSRTFHLSKRLEINLGLLSNGGASFRPKSIHRVANKTKVKFRNHRLMNYRWRAKF